MRKRLALPVLCLLFCWPMAFYPVGVTTLQIDDPSRSEEGQPRGLQTEIWYPAMDEARDLPKSLSDRLRLEVFKPRTPQE